MNHKPRILIVPDIAWWIIGQMGKQIIARFSHKYDFYFVPATVLGRRPDLLDLLLPSMDLIHCINDDGTLEAFMRFDRRALPPIVTWIHHVTTWSANQQTAVEMSSAITVCTGEWKRFVEQHTGGRIPVTVISHGVDASFFRSMPVNRARFGIPPDRFAIGFLGSKGSDLDQGRKGTRVLFEVVRRVALHRPDVHVVIGGPGWENELAELKALGISSNATGFIRQSELPALYSALDVYLLTSRVEGGPCTVFEAMACETPVVATRVGAVPELIVDGVNGFSAEVDDVDVLASAIETLAQLSPAARSQMGQQARATVSARPWQVALSPLEGLYDSWISKGRPSRVPADNRSWLGRPDALLRATCAADALLLVYKRLRKHSMRPGKGLRMLREMLSGTSIADIAKGAAMIRRYRPEFLPLKPATAQQPLNEGHAGPLDHRESL